MTNKLSNFMPGPLGTTIKYGSLLSGGWSSSFADTLQYKNELGNCGTVADINSFTAFYSVWYQGDF